MTAPTQRQKATWTVYQQILGAEVFASGDTPDRNDPLDAGVNVLVEIDTNVVARTAADACWKIAETTLKDQSTGSDPPTLVASRNGTAYGLNEARPYALKPTVERVK